MSEQERKYWFNVSKSVFNVVALLSGARNHRQADLAQKLYDRMRSLFPDHKSNLIAASILVSNIYSSLGDYEQSKEIRRSSNQTLWIESYTRCHLD